ncbi:MAG: hypothetical protein AAF615_09140, partial [Pseudomonadota bacterium]
MVGPLSSTATGKDSLSPGKGSGRRIMHIWLPRLPTDRMARRRRMSPLMAGADLRASAEGGAADAPVVVVGKQNGALFVEAVNDCAQV